MPTVSGKTVCKALKPPAELKSEKKLIYSQVDMDIDMDREKKVNQLQKRINQVQVQKHTNELKEKIIKALGTR